MSTNESSIVSNGCNCIDCQIDALKARLSSPSPKPVPDLVRYDERGDMYIVEGEWRRPAF